MPRLWAAGQFPVCIASEKLGLNFYVNSNAVFTSPFYLLSCLYQSLLCKISLTSFTFVLCPFFNCMFILFATVLLSFGERPSAVWRRQNNHYLFRIAALHFQKSFRCQDSGRWKAAGALFQCILYIFRNQINADNYLVY